MADSYIYTLPQTINPTLSDFTVVDAYVLSAGGYVTSKSTLFTLAQSTSSTIATALTSQQPITNWNTAFDGVTMLSGGWTVAQNVVQSSSAVWSGTVATVQAGSATWYTTTSTVQSNSSTWGSGGDAYTKLQQASANWQGTYETVSALSAAWNITGSPIDSQTVLQEISGDIFDVQTLSTFESPTALTATGEFMMVTVNGQPRAIQLWQY